MTSFGFDGIRWWKNLDLLPVLTFTRDRVVESFLWAVGVAYEPQYASLRKWLTKAIVLVLIIDDVYDIYASKHELDHFTTAVERYIYVCESNVNQVIYNF